MRLVERIERLLIYRDAAAAHDPNVQRELVDIWRILGKDICRTCQDKLYSAMIQLRKLDITAMSKRVSQIKDGEYIMVPFTSDPYTNANLTDAIARKLLKEYPPLASSFKKLPPDSPQEGDEDFDDPDALQKQEEEAARQTSLQAENERLKQQIAALTGVGGGTAPGGGPQGDVNQPTLGANPLPPLAGAPPADPPKGGKKGPGGRSQKEAGEREETGQEDSSTDAH